MRNLRLPADNARRRASARGARLGFLLGTGFPVLANLLDHAVTGIPWSLESTVRLHLHNPLHWIIDLAPIVFAIAGAFAASSQSELGRHRENLEASVRDQTAALVKFAGDLERKNAALRRANRAAESSRARFEQLFRGLPIAAFTLDADGLIAFWNAEAERLYGRSATDAVGRRPSEVLPFEGDPEQIAESIELVLEGSERRAMEDVVIQPDGRRVSVLCNTFPLFAIDGQILGVVSTATDTSDLKEMETELERQLQRNRAASEELVRMNSLLREQATTDGLTGLKNHRAFQVHLRSEFKSAAARGMPLSMAMIDADYFKAYNDTFGHPKGDDYLQTLASLITAGTRQGDFVARYGGEEFAVLLPGSGPEEALEIAERLRSLVEGAYTAEHRVTISVGVATVFPPDGEPAALVKAADRALYDAKARGRNRSVHIRDVDTPPNAVVESDRAWL